ncbi:MAG: SDR family NAD(P)-dependent oxidoreductase [Gammaproteobacteria bacterium]
MNPRLIPHEYTPSPDVLSGKVLLITGAGDGIGAATAQACAAAGATVILLGRTLAKLERIYDRITEAGHAQPAIYPMNLEGAAPKDYQDLASVVENEFGQLNGLIHNASSAGTVTPIEQYNPDLWHQVIQVNLNAPFMLTASCLPLMIGSGDARIIFMSDRILEPHRPYWGAYAASKFGQYGLMCTIAAEGALRDGLWVNAYYPGAVNTRFRTNAYPGIDPEQWPGPDTITNDFLYLLGSEEAKTNGEVYVRENAAPAVPDALQVDGG